MATTGSSAQGGSVDEADELNEHVTQPADPDGLVAAEEQKRWQELHSTPSATPLAVYRPARTWRKVLLISVLLIAAAVAAYWVGNHEATKGKGGQGQPNASHQNQPKQTSAVQSRHYNSTNYALSLDYPGNWTINDTTTALTITSPTLQLPTVSGAKTDVHVVMSIQNPQTNLPGFPSTGATAALGSDHLSYTKPSSIQRAQTYLSYLSYSSADALDALYITGDNGYQQGQVIPLSDIIRGDPLIGVDFKSCGTSCADGKSVTLSASAWQSSAASKDIVSIIQSIVLQ